MMRLRLLVGLVAVACAVQVAHSAMHELLPYNARASDNATVVSGNARFTVLTDRLVRMEYSDDGHFEDRPSMAFVNRALPVPKFAASTNAGVLTITTAAVELSYTVGQAFSSASLRMRSTNSSSTFKAWSFGMANDGNLLGTIRSLDDIGGPISLNCTTNAATKVHDEHLHCEWGLVSRSGWSVVDDSDNAMWDETTGYVAETPVVRNRDTHDLYMFAHGNDFRGALYDFQLIGGKAAMVPRYVLGVMWSRWYDLSSYDIRKVVESYSSRSIPLDVFVLDMDWHPLPWSGYSFDKALFPFPSDAMGWLAHKGLHTAANLHDAMGVNSFEATYPAFAKALGVDPSSGATIEFDVVNATYMFNLEDLVLKPVADAGLDHWWIDWQQGGTQGGCTGGKHNPTILTNQVRATDPFRTHENTRTFLLSRFGGLGNHRYQVGFSGDVAHSWSSLAFQPYFSATATNVAFGYWSHDIIAAGTDHEMHTRWIQFGAYSGVFRSHDAGASGGGCADTSPPSCSIVEVWKVPTEYFEANRDALQARAALLPYLYTLARENYDSGVGPTRPMYYDFPSFDEAYLIDPNGNYAQYMIGSDMMVAPVVVPMDSDSQMATIEFWIPPGMWYEQTSGVLHKGPKKLRKAYALSEVPVFIRAGAVLPTVPVRAGDTLAMARRQFTKLIASIYPGDNAGSTSVYEDDGMSLDYTSDKFERTHISYTRKTGTSLSVSMSTTGNGFAGSEAKRAWEVRVVSSMMASKVTVDGHEVPYVRFGVSESATDAWSYDGVTLELIVALAPRNKNSAVTVDIETSATPAGFDFSGVRGAIAHAILCKLTVDADRTNVGSIQATTRLSTSGDALSYLAGHDSSAFSHALVETTMLQNMAATEVLNLRPDVVPDNALSQAYSDERRDTVLCGTNDCRTTNVAYSRQRIEGYQPKQGDTDVVPLKCYWNAATNDNYVTTETTIPAGYAPCDWDDGNVFSVAKANTAALDVYISSDHHHHLTTATPQGRDWATFNGYTLLHAAIGHVYTSSQGGSSTSSPPVGLTSPSRAAHCMSLMKNANNE